MDFLQEAKSPVHLLFGAIMALLGFFGRRELKRFDDKVSTHDKKIEALETGRVSRDDFDELRASLTASIVHGVERIEKSVEKRHQENRDDMTELRADVRSLLRKAQ